MNLIKLFIIFFLKAGVMSVFSYLGTCHIERTREVIKKNQQTKFGINNWGSRTTLSVEIHCK
jgi:hypothetical protein